MSNLYTINRRLFFKCIIIMLTAEYNTTTKFLRLNYVLLSFFLFLSKD